MSMWVRLDQGSGVYVDRGVGKLRDKEGRSYTDQFPDLYREIPAWMGLLLMLASSIYRRVQRIVYRHISEEQRGEKQ